MTVGYPMVPAAHQSAGRRLPVQIVVIHTVEAQELATTAVNAARYYAGASAPRASMHAVIGADPTHTGAPEIIETVHWQDTAYAAPPANDYDLAGQVAGAGGFHVEHVGYAAQTVAQWADAFSRGELDNSAAYLAAKVVEINAGQPGAPPIRPIRLNPAQVGAALTGNRTVTGFCGHRDVNKAMRLLGKTPESDHTDPGASFPWLDYLGLISAHLTAPKPPGTTQPNGVPLVATAAEITAIADASALAVLRFPIHHGPPVGDVAFLQAFANLAAKVDTIAVHLGL